MKGSGRIAKGRSRKLCDTGSFPAFREALLSHFPDGKTETRAWGGLAKRSRESSRSQAAGSPQTCISQNVTPSRLYSCGTCARFVVRTAVPCRPPCSCTQRCSVPSISVPPDRRLSSYYPQRETKNVHTLRERKHWIKVITLKYTDDKR